MAYLQQAAEGPGRAPWPGAGFNVSLQLTGQMSVWQRAGYGHWVLMPALPGVPAERA